MGVIFRYFHIILLKKASTVGVFSVDPGFTEMSPWEKAYLSWTIAHL